MRIIAGKYRGRVLRSPAGNDIRPTSDRVKEAVFSSLDSKVGIVGLKFLDAFCGSGGLGIEAMSRGASEVNLMDIDTKLAKMNISSFEHENIQIINCNALNPIPSSQVMDVILIDPPYAMQAGDKAIRALIKSGWADKNTMFVVEADKDDDSIIEQNYSYFNKKQYGKTIIYYLKA